MTLPSNLLHFGQTTIRLPTDADLGLTEPIRLTAGPNTKGTWTRGRAVVDGELKYTSPSQIVAFDPASYGGCNRRWGYRRLFGKPEPEGAAAASGTQGHAEIAEYLHTGKNVLGRHALNAKRFLPPPDPKLLLEVPIHGEGGAPDTLLAAGVPLVGFIDWMNLSRQVALDHEPAHYDPAKSGEVVDWKFTGRKEFPSPREVAEAHPMVVYGEWAARKFSLDHVRLSHVYISTRRRETSKRTVLVRRQDLLPRWEKTEAVVRRMQQAAKACTPEDLEPNLDACGAYDGGCPHRSYCKAGQENSLVSLIGAAGAAAILAEPAPPQESPIMSLLKIPALANLAAEKEKLITEERAAAQAPVDPAVRAAIETIRAAAGVQVQGQALGQPALGGEAAKVWAQVTGLDFRGAGIAGSGLLAETNIMDPADLPKLATELTPYAVSVPASPAPVQSTAIAPPLAVAPVAGGLLPPDAPESKPQSAPSAVVNVAPAPVTPQVHLAPGARYMGEATPLQVDTGHEAPDDVREGTPLAPPEEKGELKLSKKARAEFERLQERVKDCERMMDDLSSDKLRLIARIGELEATGGPAPAAAPAGVTVFVDAIPPTAGYRDLREWIGAYAGKLADQYGAPDIRMAPKGTPLEFGQWKGALSALLRAAPLADGVYFLDTRGSELAEIAAEALAIRFPRRVTRGIR